MLDAALTYKVIIVPGVNVINKFQITLPTQKWYIMHSDWLKLVT